MPIHLRAEPGDYAEAVLLPGDPLRAKYIAETYFDDPVQFNAVRNMLGFTGTVRGRPVSVMGTGMGIPSISIYAHELVHTFGATRLIRVGTCGAIHPDLDLYDIVVAQGASTDSGVLAHYGLPGTFAPLASYALLTVLVASVTDLEPGDFVHTFGDVHLYLNHVDQARLQLTREPRPLPRLRLARLVTDLATISADDIVVEGYDPHPRIAAPIAV